MTGKIKIAVYIHNDNNGSESGVDFQAVAEYAKGLPNVARVQLFREAKHLEPVALSEDF